MVMRNRHEGNDTPHWWDDLPPHVKARFTQPLRNDEDRSIATELQPQVQPQPAFSRGDFLIDLSRFAVIFIFVSGFILLYMLLALSYIIG